MTYFFSYETVVQGASLLNKFPRQKVDKINTLSVAQSDRVFYYNAYWSTSSISHPGYGGYMIYGHIHIIYCHIDIAYRHINIIYRHIDTVTCLLSQSVV